MDHTTPSKELWNTQFCEVPRGSFVMGSPVDDAAFDDDEKPEHRLDLPYDFWMARHPVTVAQFRRFVDATDHRTSAEKAGWAWVWDGADGQWVAVEGAHWHLPLGPGGGDAFDDRPVVTVSFHDASAYCVWLDTIASGDRPEGWHARLPSEAEWEKAARGPEGRVWPWGDEFRPSLCTFAGTGVGEVDPIGLPTPVADSPYGVSDLCGNAWEWTTTLWGPERRVRAFAYPYRLDDGRDDPTADDTWFRIIRGGSFKDDPHTLRSACRDLDPPSSSLNNLGFRVVVGPDRHAV